MHRVQKIASQVCSRQPLDSFRNFTRHISNVPRSVLVSGGNGALGKAVVSTFKANGWHITSVDYKENKNADVNLLLNAGTDWNTNVKTVLEKLSSQKTKFGVVVNVSGGWAGGGAKDFDTINNLDAMISMNLQSSVTAAHIACNHLSENGLVVLTGAAPVYKGGTPGMLSYGISKAGVHFVVKSISSEDGGLPTGGVAVCILPDTIDTEANRIAMPAADFNTWTRPSVISEVLLAWASTPSSTSTARVPPLVNGSFYTFKTYKRGASVVDFCNDTEIAYRFSPAS